MGTNTASKVFRVVLLVGGGMDQFIDNLCVMKFLGCLIINFSGKIRKIF